MTASWGVRDLHVERGGRTTLASVSLAVPAGGITAVVGGDGAGKTTLMQVMTGLLHPTRGTVTRPPARKLGAMSEVGTVWVDLTVDEHINFVAEAYGLTREVRAERARTLLGRADLDETRGRVAGNLSGGMRQKLAVVLAMLHQPDLLVLDEPSTGVDPTSRAELWRLIGHAAAEGAAVLLATTYLDEAERAASVLVLDRGEALLQGDPAALMDRSPSTSLEGLVMQAQRDRERVE